MQHVAPPWRRAVIAVIALLAVVIGPPGPVAFADTVSKGVAYRCDGTALIATLHSGDVDAQSIPNSIDGTVPGAFVVLQGAELTLQLPRTNNAGAASFTDGQWWWSLEDPDHPRFLRRRGLGDIQTLVCERTAD